jgi:hypothetical protein
MLFESPFSNATLDNLEAGDFFFHSLAEDEYSPAIKVTRSNGATAVIDLNYEHQNKRRLPTLVGSEGFENLTVIGVENAVIRPAPGLTKIKYGAVTDIDRAALIIAPTHVLLRVRGTNMGYSVFNVTKGQEVQAPEYSQCLAAAEWQIVVSVNDEEMMLFERKP